MLRFLNNFRRSSPAAGTFRPLHALADLDEAISLSDSRPVLIFKHSSACGYSALIRRGMGVLTLPDDPTVFELVVQQSRALSRTVEERLGVIHQTPQAILVRQGKVVWSGSAGMATPEAVRSRMEQIRS